MGSCKAADYIRQTDEEIESLFKKVFASNDAEIFNNDLKCVDHPPFEAVENYDNVSSQPLLSKANRDAQISDFKGVKPLESLSGFSQTEEVVNLVEETATIFYDMGIHSSYNRERIISRGEHRVTERIANDLSRLDYTKSTSQESYDISTETIIIHNLTEAFDQESQEASNLFEGRKQKGDIKYFCDNAVQEKSKCNTCISRKYASSHGQQQSSSPVTILTIIPYYRSGEREELLATGKQNSISLISTPSAPLLKVSQGLKFSEASPVQNRSYIEPLSNDQCLKDSKSQKHGIRSHLSFINSGRKSHLFSRKRKLKI
ncbi:hypothetical protein KAFR_0E01570 [Kazachstania africana CBS 2517]|uniref:Uncharacterized protein n=1 Tax=Kazachstania africana (strain ATCC 22294 / BCRC 22015 / CBS 2517 / CECT 1963 / NBRC 1671 / NRRL Y-8276) TaxID=1071382 RepID=H2AVB1_KAZAF|nr:hypothetical protein KAFR_0E01570 [Kazachstania africana CBS 2517]CCF58311.1 hypothetical protein KAFR_0E01570 [Kazachstania africana CBS 2517]